MRQLCNLAFALRMEQTEQNPQAQQEFLEELNEPLDPMAQLDKLKMIPKAGGE